MARPSLNEEDRLINATTRISTQVLAEVERIAAERDWSVSKTLRRLIERGLYSEIHDGPVIHQQPESPQAASAL